MQCVISGEFSLFCYTWNRIVLVVFWLHGRLFWSKDRPIILKGQMGKIFESYNQLITGLCSNIYKKNNKKKLKSVYNNGAFCIIFSMTLIVCFNLKVTVAWQQMINLNCLGSRLFQGTAILVNLLICLTSSYTTQTYLVSLPFTDSYV